MADLKFTPEEDNLLITLIEENKLLYDPECELYKDIATRDNIWDSIANYLDKSDEECRKRWKHIRDSYNRYKRKRKSGARTRCKNSKWEFYQRLSFLEKVPLEESVAINVHENCDSDNVSCPCVYFSLPHSTAPSDHQLEDEYEQDIDESKPIGIPLALSSPLQITHLTCHKRPKIEESQEILNQNEEIRHQPTNERTEMKVEEMDDDWTFGNHVKTVLKKLTPRLNIIAKKEIFDILTKYETLDLDMKELRP